MTNRSYKPQKQSSALPMAASQMSGQGEQQQQQETARCLNPFLTLFKIHDIARNTAGGTAYCLVWTPRGYVTCQGSSRSFD